MQPRFRIVKSLSKVIFIKDAKDGTIVAAVYGYGRSEEKTDAMAKVMMEALNREVEKYHARQTRLANE